MTHLDHMKSITEDIGDAVAIVTRALERAHREIDAQQARAAGQQELPLPGAAPAAAPATTSPAIHRLLTVVDAIEAAVESNRRQAALDACREVRDLLDRL